MKDESWLKNNQPSHCLIHKLCIIDILKGEKLERLTFIFKEEQRKDNTNGTKKSRFKHISNYVKYKGTDRLD